MEQIETWVYDQTAERRLILEIPSYSLRKALSKAVTRQYRSTGVFTDFNRDVAQTTIKKNKSFKQEKFLRGFARPDSVTDSQKVGDFGFCDSQMIDFDPSHEDEHVKDSDSLVLGNDEESKGGSSSGKSKSVSCGETTLRFTQTIKQPKKTFDDLDAENKAKVEEKYNDEVGFTRVIEMLKKGRKPLIGHNMFFDVIYLYNQFIGELPDNFIEFAKSFHSIFPELYDTRAIACSISD